MEDRRWRVVDRGWKIEERDLPSSGFRLALIEAGQQKRAGQCDVEQDQENDQ
jgi:hypothetical protein